MTTSAHVAIEIYSSSPILVKTRMMPTAISKAHHPPGLAPQYDFMPHQVQAIRGSKEHPGIRVNGDCGTGKTLIGCGIIAQYILEILRGAPTRSLVVCPPSVLYQWQRTFAAFFPEISDRVIVLDKPIKECAEIVKNRESGILITNFQKLSYRVPSRKASKVEKEKRLDHLYLALLRWKPRMIVVDESQNLRGFPPSTTGKHMAQLGRNALHRVCLSGSPTPNGANDLIYQLLFLRPDLYPTQAAILGKYFEDKNKDKHWFKWREIGIRDGCAKKLRADISPFTYTAKIEEVEEYMPEQVTQERIVTLTPEQQKHYDAMKSNLITAFKEPLKPGVEPTACIAPNAISCLMRLRQICNGYLVLNDKSIEWLPCSKDAELRDVLQQIVITQKEQLIIWASLSPCIERIRNVIAELNIPYEDVIEVHGEVTGKKRDNALALFEQGRRSIAVCHPGAGGVGIDQFRFAKYMMYYDKDWDYEADYQSYRRMYRKGNKAKAVTRIDCYAKNTTEETIHYCLQSKMTEAEFYKQIEENL